MNDMVSFMKTLALPGGALSLLGVEEPWPVSLPLEQPSAAVRDYLRKLPKLAD